MSANTAAAIGLLGWCRQGFEPELAAEYQSKEELAEEISQLLYHLQVLMLDADLSLDDVYAHL